MKYLDWAGEWRILHRGVRTEKYWSHLLPLLFINHAIKKFSIEVLCVLQIGIVVDSVNKYLEHYSGDNNEMFKR